MIAYIKRDSKDTGNKIAKTSPFTPNFLKASFNKYMLITAVIILPIKVQTVWDNIV